MVKLADKDLDNGAFTGLFYSEFSTDLDQTANKTIPPVLLRGPGTVKIWNAALDSGSTYAVSASAVVELCAGDNGLLIPRGALTGPTVGHLVEVQADGIIVNLLQPSSQTD